MARKPIITNPMMMKHPFLAGSKLVLVFLFPLMCLDMPPNFYYQVYLPFIVPLIYFREILGLILPLVGHGNLVDNKIVQINWIYVHCRYYGYHNVPYYRDFYYGDDFIHHYDHSHRH